LRRATVRWWGAAAIGLCMVAADGCRKSAPPVERESAKPATRSLNALDPATLGLISGQVKFAGTAPAPVRIDPSSDPACGSGERFSEDYVVHEGMLVNVYVYVKSGPAEAMAQGASWMAPAVLDVKGCSFVPHVVAVSSPYAADGRAAIAPDRHTAFATVRSRLSPVPSLPMPMTATSLRSVASSW